MQTISAKSLQMIERIETYTGDLTGKRILDIGSDKKGELIKSICSVSEVEHIYGINPVIAEDERSDKFSLLNGTATDLQFDDNYFDVIVSLAAFEHFFDLDKSLSELYRVLKPGGTLYTIFGPIWSSAWGHHLWAYDNGECFNYQNTPLPAFCHLTMDEQSLAAHLSNSHSESQIATIVNYVFHSDEQNRMFYSDYESAFYESPFDVLLMFGHTELPYKNGYELSDYQTVLKQVVKRYPGKKGFGYSSISTLLSK